MGKKFRKFRVLEKIIHRKQKIYMVHTLFLTDSQNFNPIGYTPYTVVIYEHLFTHFEPMTISQKFENFELSSPIVSDKAYALCTSTAPAV